MAMDSAEAWRQCFQKWPDELHRRGVVVSSFDEQIPFVNFSASSEMLLVERRAPDTVGARLVMLPYRNIVGLKIVDVVKPKVFAAMGFDVVAGKK